MKFKSLMHKVMAAMLALPLIPSLAHAFQAAPAHRADYNGWTPHEHWDAVWHETMLDITVLGVIFALVTIAFMVMYVRKGHGERGKLPTLTNQAKIGWVVLPCMLFLGDDLFLYVKGFDLHNHYREVPTNAVEVKLTGSMWNWNYVDVNDIDSDNELVVKQGTPVVLRMVSDDVLHSHYMNRYRVTEDLMPGRITWQWFMPDQLGESVVTCREYCGTMHSGMYGKVIVKSAADYDAYVAEQTASIPSVTGVAKAATAADQI